IAPPPPSPLIQGSSTPSANVVAITASTQSPPAASTSAPTCAALPDCAATMPPLDVVAGLRICWLLLNWSRMLLPLLSVTLRFYFAWPFHHGYWLGMSSDTL